MICVCISDVSPETNEVISTWKNNKKEILWEYKTILIVERIVNYINLRYVDGIYKEDVTHRNTFIAIVLIQT